MAATTTTVSLDEYLATSYRPDCEYIDGRLEEKAVVGFAHGETQAALSVWFWNHRAAWGVHCAVETRTKVGSTKVRLPDFVIVSAASRERGTLTLPPLVAIEVLSPTDSYADLRARASDLAAMGVRNIWLLDPAACTAEVWRDGFWQPAGPERLEAVESPIFLDLGWLWSELAE